MANSQKKLIKMTTHPKSPILGPKMPHFGPKPKNAPFWPKTGKQFFFQKIRLRRSLLLKIARNEGNFDGMTTL